MGPLCEALLQGYRYSARDFTPERLGLYTAIGLLRLAPDPFRHRDPDWAEATEAILWRAERLLGGGPHQGVREGSDAVAGRR